MSGDIKNMAASVRQRLYNIAKKEKINFDLILLLFMQERLLYRLSISQYNFKFILKGGLLILSKTDIKTRPTRDIDFLGQDVSNDIGEIKSIIKKISQINVNDGVVYDPESITVERITEGADYEGVRIKINSFLGNARKRLQLDIGFGDVIVPKMKEIIYPGLLDFDYPKLNSYTYESVIAEKFEIMLRLSLINSRMKDFYDIYLLSAVESFDGRILQEAIFSTFERRGTPLKKDQKLFNEAFSENKDKIKQWNGYLIKIGQESISFKEVMKRIKTFLLPIYECILYEKEFFGEWDSDNGKWVKYNK